MAKLAMKYNSRWFSIACWYKFHRETANFSLFLNSTNDLMDHDWTDDRRSTHAEYLSRLSEEVLGAIVLLTTIRTTGRSLEGIPESLIAHLSRLLGPDQVAEILSIDDDDLVIQESAIPER